MIRTTASKAIEKRLNQIAEDIDSILDKFKPDVVAVEQLYSHYAHPRTAILMGHARGVILQRCAEAGVEVKSFGATRIKKSYYGQRPCVEGADAEDNQDAFGIVGCA